MTGEPKEIGWYWVETNPGWNNALEVVFVGYPEYHNNLHVYELFNITPLDEYCKKLPRRWFGKVEEPNR